MPITGIDWKDGEGYDIHMLRGMQGSALLGLLEVTETDGSVDDAIDYLADNADVTIEFQPSFKNTPDAGANPPTCTGFGITINNTTGSFLARPPVAADPVIHNCLIHVTAHDSKPLFGKACPEHSRRGGRRDRWEEWCGYFSEFPSQHTIL
jgi:hypothetical protein